MHSLLAALAALASALGPTPACSVDWDGGAGTVSWLDAANWSGDALPSKDDQVCLPAGAQVSYAGPAATTIAGLQSDRPLKVSGGALTVAGATALPVLALAGGSFDAGGPAELQTLQQTGGTLGGGGTVTVRQLMRWSGGTQAAGETIVGPQATGGLEGAGDKVLADRTLLLASAGLGSAWSAGDLELRGGATVRNTGTLLLGASLRHMRGSGTLVNAGEITAMEPAFIDVAFEGEPGSTLHVGDNSGIDGLQLSAGTEHGALALDRDAVLTLSGGTFTLAADSQVSGEPGALVAAVGTVDVAGAYTVPTTEVSPGGDLGFIRGSHTLDTLALGGGRLRAGTPLTVGTLEQSGGELTGGAVVTVNGLFEWTGGSESGSGQTVVAAARGSLGMGIGGADAKTLTGRTLRNDTASAWTGGHLELASGATVDNRGTLVVSGDPELKGAGRLVNAGTLDVRGGTILHVPLADSGVIEIAGALDLEAGSSHTGASVNLEPGAALQVSGGKTTLDAASTLAGRQAVVAVTGGSFEAAGHVDVRTVSLSGGTVALSGASRLQKLALTSGTARLGGTPSAGVVANNGGTVAIDGPLAVNGTYLQTAGTTQLAGRIDGAKDMVVDVAGGVLSGSGVVHARLRNSGEVGAVTVEGDYEQKAAGRLNLAPPGRLSVTGTATLAGTLAVSGQPTADVQIVRSGARRGVFATVEGVPRAAVEYRRDGVYLVAAACPAPRRFGAALGDPRNLSRSAARSLYPALARVEGGMGAVWLEEGHGLRYRAASDDGDLSAPMTLTGEEPGELWRWDIASAGRHVYVVWEQRPLGETAREVWLAASDDGGRTFRLPLPVSRTPGQTSWFPRLGASGDSVSVVWTEYEDGTLMLARSDDGGRTFPAPHAVARVRPGAYAVAQNGAVAWEDGGTVSVEAGGAKRTVAGLDSLGAIAADRDALYVAGLEGGEARVATGRGGSWSAATLGPATGVTVAAADGLAVAAWSDGDQVFASTGPFAHSIAVAPTSWTRAPEVAVSEGHVHVATWVVTAGLDRVLLASSADGGDTFSLSGDFELAGCGALDSVLPRVAASGSAFGVAWQSLSVSDTPPWYGDFEIGYRPGQLAEPNLTLLDVAPVQATREPVTLAAGKPTVVRAQIRSTIPATLAVAVRLRHPGGTEDDTVQIRPGVQDVYLPLRSPLLPAPGGFETTVVLDPEHELDQSDRSDDARTVTAPVKDTRGLMVLVVPVHVKGEPAVPCAAAERIRAGTERFVDAAFPVDPLETHFEHRCEAIEIEDRVYDDRELDAVFEPLETAALTAGYDMAVGVVRSGWFAEHTTETEALALAPYGHGHGVLAEAQNVGGWPVAHELAHTLGWVAEGAPGASGHHQQDVPAPGYVADPPQALDRVDLMHDSAGLDALPTDPVGRWIAPNTWDFLLHKLAVDQSDPPVIALSGTVGADGRVQAGPWYELDGVVDAPLGSRGELGVRYLDGQRHVLASTGFDPVHTYDGLGLSDRGLAFAPFALRVPAVPGAQALQITRGDDVLYERSRSAHAPTVDVTAPGGGAFRPGDAVDVAWNAGDADGDRLSQLVQLTTDGGRTWTALAEHVTGSSHRFTVPATAALATARVRVIVSDGWNTATGLSAPFTVGDAPQLAFTGNGSGCGNRALYLVYGDGSELRQLTDHCRNGGDGTFDQRPAWSPEGRQIAFERWSLDAQGACCEAALYAIGADGSNPRVVLAHADRSINGGTPAPDWSPDGRRLVFRLDQELNVIDADGTGLRPLGVSGEFPRWSPDGAQIAYVVRGQGGLRLVGADGRGDHEIAPSAVESAPSWSSDGRRLAFADVTGVRIVDADGSHLRLVRRLDGAGDVAWSPDGERLAFSCCAGAQPRLFTIGLDGGEPVPVTDGPGPEEHPDWKPAAPPPGLRASAGGPYAADEGRDVILTASASAASATFDWDLDGDGAYDDAGGATATASFPDDGTFVVRVRARGDTGEPAGAAATVVVANAAPALTAATATRDARDEGVLRAVVTDADALRATLDWGDGAEPAPLIRAGTSYEVLARHAHPGEAVRLTVDDGDGGVLSRTLPLVPAPPNRAPVTRDVDGATDAGVPVDLSLEAFDPDGDALRLRVVAAPAHGTLIAVGQGTYVYKPDPGYAGADRFTFVAGDGLAESAAATASLTVRGRTVEPAPPPAAPPGGEPAGPVVYPAEAAAQLLLTCAGRDVALLEVLHAGRRVRVSGVARTRLAGRPVRILLHGRRVGTALVGADGRFTALVAAPRRPAQARYRASIGAARSTPLRLVRRMVGTTLRREGATLVLRGRLTPPFARRPAPIAVERRRSCGNVEAVRTPRVLPDRHGRFVVRFPVPSDHGASIYRARTRVPVRGGGAIVTFTLPQPVDL